MIQQELNKQIVNGTINLFEQLTQLAEQLTPLQYCMPLPLFSGSSIGQHYRHVIELYQQLQKGYVQGLVNYENRQRDVFIETDKIKACNKLLQIAASINKPDKAIQVESIIDASFNQPVWFASSYARELLYNIEHCIHHMALIKIGVSTFENINLPTHFGVAAATLKYRTTCAQ
jgi:hypothetical protein